MDAVALIEDSRVSRKSKNLVEMIKGDQDLCHFCELYVNIAYRLNAIC